MSWLELFLYDESGQALAEYGLIIALTAVATIAALTAFKEARENMFTYILNKLTDAIG